MRALSDRIAGMIVVVLALITMIAAVTANVHLEQTTACQAQFNQSYREALAERTDAATKERNAQRTLVLAVSDADPSNNRAALDAYRTALDRADAQRHAHPVPSLRVCR